MSLRARLLIAVGLISILALVAADFATYSALRSFLINRVDQTLLASRSPIIRATTAERIPSDCTGTVPHQLSPPTQRGPGTAPVTNRSAGGIDELPPNAVFTEYVQIRIPVASGGTRVEISCPAFLNKQQYEPILPTTITGYQTDGDGLGPDTFFDAPSEQKGGPEFRVRAVLLKDRTIVVVADPLSDTVGTLHDLFLIELAVTAAALALAILAGFVLVRIGLRPLSDVERTAESIAAGNLNERVPGENDRTEVGRMTRTINVMLARIESAFSARLATEQRLRENERQLRRFVADASHELRTPIAAVSAYAELFDRGASESQADLERVIRGIRSETARMEQLVTDLMTLARFDEGQAIERVPTELVSVCADAVRTAATVGSAWPVRFTAREPVEVVGDPVRLRQVIDNLLANVRAHTPEGTAATVSLERNNGHAVIVVQDEGPGIAGEDLDHLFERFYRADPSRSRQNGGAGLGLSIVAAIVAAHDGEVGASSNGQRGTSITVRLPVAPELELPSQN